MLAGDQQVLMTLDSWAGAHPVLHDLALWGSGTRRYLLSSPQVQPDPSAPADYINMTGQPGRTVSLTPRERSADKIRFQGPTEGYVAAMDGVFPEGRYLWILADHTNVHQVIEAALGR